MELRKIKKHQVLFGATGIGKTFTIANVIAQVNKPTLVLAYNKTLAGQLYAEFKELFSNNHVEYFVSYYGDHLKYLLFWVFSTVKFKKMNKITLTITRWTK